MASKATPAGSTSAKTAAPRILVVDDEPAMIELVNEIASRRLHCRVVSAGSLGEARKALAGGGISLLLADVNLPDGDGTALVPELRQRNASAEAIIITGAPTMDRAIQAMRQGAVDFLPKPFSAEEIIDRVEKALARQVAGARADRRIQRLRQTVRRLSEARRIVGQQVDLLCNDLIGAYGHLARQLNDMRHQEGFRGYIGRTQDLEQMLCHTMDWLLRQLGYCNVAIWLACDDQDFQLGAYMKHTLPGEQAMTDAMKEGLVHRTLRQGHLLLNGEDVQHQLTASELDYLADQSLLSVNCTYLGESLAVIALFRDQRTPFTEEHAGLLKQISPIFAAALAEMVKAHTPAEPADNPFDDGFPAAGNEAADPADWWKRGEAPPY